MDRQEAERYFTEGDLDVHLREGYTGPMRVVHGHGPGWIDPASSGNVDMDLNTVIGAKRSIQDISAGSSSGASHPFFGHGQGQIVPYKDSPFVGRHVEL